MFSLKSGIQEIFKALSIGEQLKIERIRNFLGFRARKFNENCSIFHKTLKTLLDFIGIFLQTFLFLETVCKKKGWRDSKFSASLVASLTSIKT